MGRFTEEMNTRKEQKRLFHDTDKSLKERIMSSVKTEIIPRIDREYQDLDIKMERVFLAETEDGGFSLCFEVAPMYGSYYKLVNRDLKKVYEAIEQEYGIKVSGFRSVMKFS